MRERDFLCPYDTQVSITFCIQCELYSVQNSILHSMQQPLLQNNLIEGVIQRSI